MSRASAAPVDTVLPIPVAGLATGPTGLGGPLVGQHVTATTDTERPPGITEFRGTEGICACMVHWRNLTTGVAGTSNNFWFGLPATGATAITGSGVLVATVTTSGAGSPITVLPRRRTVDRSLTDYCALNPPFFERAPSTCHDCTAAVPASARPVTVGGRYANLTVVYIR